MQVSDRTVLIQSNGQLQKYRDSDPQNNRSALVSHYQHARERAKQRYNFHLNEQDWERLNWDVFRETDKTTFVTAKNDETTVWDVEFTPNLGRTRTIRVYFHEYLYCVTTLVPIVEEYMPSTHSWSEGLKKRRLIRYEHGQQQIAKEMAVEEKVLTDSPFAILKDIKPVVPKSRLTAGSAMSTVESAFGKPPKGIEASRPAQPVVVTPPPKEPIMVVRAANAKIIAQNLWQSFEGEEFADKDAVFTAFVAALTAEHEDQKDAMENIVARSVGNGLADAHNYPIMDIPMRISTIFKMSEMEGHPMQPVCRAFITKHRLYLDIKPSGGPKHKHTICQYPRPSRL